MKQLFIYLLCCIFFFGSCEDKKKATTTEKESGSNIKKEKTDYQLDSVTVKSSEENEYPKITNENVVAFLTQYGAENPETKVLITTTHGDIEIELFKDTPLHRANFIYLVKQQYFDDTFFHRVVPNFIIQGGNSDIVSTPRKRNKIGNKYLLPAEIIPSRNHTYGTISGAKEYRENPDKKSAPFEFFIFLGPQTSTSHLEGNYTVFGKVTKGMEIVEKIAELPADDGDWPLQNVYITAKILQ